MERYNIKRKCADCPYTYIDTCAEANCERIRKTCSTCKWWEEHIPISDNVWGFCGHNHDEPGEISENKVLYREDYGFYCKWHSPKKCPTCGGEYGNK